MASTYTPIATQTASGSASAIQFNSIPSTYTDLVLIATIKAASGTPTMVGNVGNGTLDTGTNYSDTWLYGTGSSAGSNRNSNQPYLLLAGNNYVASSEFSVVIMNFMNYSNSTTYKTVLTRTNTPSIEVAANVNLWRSTAAINVISLTLSGNFAVGSTFTLYGIKAA